MAGDSNLVLAVSLQQERDIVTVRQHAREIAALAGFDHLEQTRVSTAASEIARNALKYAGGGEIEFRFYDPGSGRQHLLITISDHGPGISNLSEILEGQFQSKTGLGKGILAARKLMDFFDIRTEPGRGTTVLLEKVLPQGSQHMTTTAVTQVAEEVRKSTPRDPFIEVQHQNQELLRALQEVQARETELARLHAILRRESDAAIHSREEQLQGIIRSAMDAIISVDEQQRIVVFNDAAARMFGCTVADAVGAPLERFTTESFRDSYAECLHDLDSYGGTTLGIKSSHVVSARRSNGEEFPIDGTVSQLRSGGQKLVTLILRDITERRRAQLLEQQLQQAQKMEAVGRLAGGVAHDFNTLLNIILGYSELLLAELPNEDRRRERAEQIERSAQTGALLTKQLLAFSRKQPTVPKVVDLNRIVLELEPMLRRLLRSDIALDVHCDVEPCPIKVDLGQIQQVVLNLATNARDAMPCGGKLGIDVRAVSLDGDRASLAPGNYAMLSVSDNGTGMDRETLEHIFEPFFTTKIAGKGTGLGLATVNGVVTQNGGEIDVQSEVGVGTVFNLYLPRSSESVETIESSAGVLQVVSGDETILLVEDSALLRELTREILSRAGYSVLEAADGVEALDLSGKYASTIHLTITDIVMPRMRGTELATHMATLRPEMAIIFLSGYTEEAVWKFEQNRLVSILEKPYTSATLLRSVRQALDQLPQRSGCRQPKASSC